MDRPIVPSFPQVGPDELARAAAASLELLKRAPFAVVVHDADLVVTGWNDGAARCFGFDEREAIGRRLGELLLSEEGVEAWRQSLANGDEPHAFELAKKGGGTVACEWRHQAVTDERGQATSWICMGVPSPVAPPRQRTIEDRVLSVVLNTLPISIWAVDKKGTYTFHDGLGVDLIGMQRGSFLGLNLWELWGAVEGTRETLRQVRVAMEEGESTHAFAEAMERYWESWCVPDRNEDGEIDGVISVTLDVTDPKRAENDLRAKLQLIERQQKLIQQLSMPIIQVADGVLTVPLVGVVDSTRAADLMDSLLSEVVRTKSRYAIIDLTGVEVVDTRTAAYLIDLVRAIRLLGAEAVITGIRALVAQTVVSLGLDLSEIPTHTNLRSGLDYCISQRSNAEHRRRRRRR